MKQIVMVLNLVALSMPIAAMLRAPKPSINFASRIAAVRTISNKSHQAYRFALITPKFEKIFRQNKQVRVKEDLFKHLAVQVSRNRGHGIDRPFDGMTALCALSSDFERREPISTSGSAIHFRNPRAFRALLERLTDNWNGIVIEGADGILRYPLLVNEKEVELSIDDGPAYQDHLAWIKNAGIKLLPDAIPPFIYVSSSRDDFIKDHEHHEAICKEFEILCQELNRGPK